MGGLISLAGYYMILGILTLWICVRVARDSGGLAFACFFFWPTCVYALIRNWGSPDSDIKIPFFFSIITMGLMVWSAERAVVQLEQMDESAYMVAAFSAEEIEEIRQDDPQLAAEIEAAQAQALDRRAGAAVVSADPPAERAASARPSVVDSSSFGNGMPTDPGVAISFRTLALREAESKLTPLRGRIDLGPAQAQLALPEHFRFVPVAQLRTMAAMGAGPVDPSTLGWVIHERTRFSDDDAWYVTVRFDAVGALVLPETAQAWQQALTAENAAAAEPELAPDWMAGPAIATLVDHADGALRARALKPLAHGVLEYAVHGLDTETDELGLRAARLMAAHTHSKQAPGVVQAADSAVNVRTLAGYARAGLGARVRAEG